MSSNLLPNFRQSESQEVEFAEQSGGRVPPHSLESERAVIGAIMLDNECLYSVLEVLQAEDFYHKSHRLLLEQMIQLSENNEPIDIVILNKSLEKTGVLEEVGGLEYLSYLVDVVPTAANAGYYARIVREMSLRRKLINVGSSIVSDAFESQSDVEEFIDGVEQKIFSVSEARVKKGFFRAGDVVKDSIKEIEHQYVNKEKITGVASGFNDLDEMTAGFQKSDLVIIAGRPSMGKTALVLSIARQVALVESGAVAVFSLEMSKEQIVMRLLCSEARVSSSAVRSGALGESEFPRLVEAGSRIAQADLFIDDTPAVSVLEMRAKARRLHREKPLSLIMVDYLQLMRGRSKRVERRDQEISEISAGLKSLAKELSVPVLALSQLNRAVESRNEKRPMMADLRESGAIEQDADLIAFVYREEVYDPETPNKGVAELIVAKHRNGPIGTVRLAFHGEYTSFENLAEDRGDFYLGEDLNLSGTGDGFSEEDLGPI